MALRPAKRNDDGDATFTLKLSRRRVAAILAVVAHVAVILTVQQFPEPKPKPKRIEMTVVKPPPPPPPEPDMAPVLPPPPSSSSKPAVKQPQAAPPETSPVVPELPPSENPPDNRAQLPVAEKSDVPAPPPTGSWKDKLSDALKTPAPSKAPTGPLAPSFGTLDRVAMSDAKLFDEQTEKKIAANFGPFFRRGIDALRSNWHPDDVLRQLGPDPTLLCGKQKRETWAVAVIDKDGKVVDIEVKKDSGCKALDTEAVAAFKRVAKFPFPPAGLFVAPDGTPTDTARWPVRFIVTFDGGYSLDWG